MVNKGKAGVCADLYDESVNQEKGGSKMKVRICPLCDSEMKKAHYCDTCKSFVWHPEILDVHYNAQQRGLGEEDCAYGAEHDRKDHKEDIYGKFSETLKKKVEKTRRNNQKHSSSHEEVYGDTGQKMTQRPYSRGAERAGAEGSKRKAGGCLGKIVLAIIILNAVIGSIGGNLWNYFTGDDFRYQIQNVLDDLGIAEDIQIWNNASESVEPAREIDYDGEDGDEWIQPEDENLGYADISHFDITKDEMEDLLSAWVNTEYGQDLQKTEDNVEQEGTYVDEDGNEYSVPEIGTYYAMGEDQDYLALYSDGDTSQVKVVTAMFEDEERAKSFGMMAASVLDPESGYDPSDWETELDELISQVKEENAGQSDYGYVSRDIDDMIVVASKFSTGEICLTFETMDFQ